MCFILESDFFYDKHTVSMCTLWVFIAVTLEEGIVFFLKKRTTPNRHWAGNLTTNPYVTITHRHNIKTGNCYWILGGPIWVAEFNVGPMWVKTLFACPWLNYVALWEIRMSPQVISIVWSTDPTNTTASIVGQTCILLVRSVSECETDKSVYLVTHRPDIEVTVTDVLF